MSGNLRREALSAFKKLHRTRLKTFQGDDHALKAIRHKINEEFGKNKNLTDQAAIQKLIKLAQDVEREIRTTVIQIVEKTSGRYEAKITADTVKVDNATFGELYDKSEFKQGGKCCGGSAKKGDKK
ncbi:complex III assembly factor LYRM7 [Copidosoma floridanum]|uniref:complex III assembly factor LYRM7 n=1 Tax=Copidosoma floridanum TaxID=29053 RepID=UPI0006C93E3D|nr:complex III assembly factor LYRM7 [Copidosoma floridanum]